jgi:uncharacterized protein YcnI
VKRSASTRALVARALGVAGVAVLVAAPMAAAHVTPDRDEAPKGGFTTVTFRVPNEEEDASTTQVEINFPTDTPITFVAVQPVPGWQYETETARLDEPVEGEDGEVTEAVSKVTYTGGEIRPGEFQEFPIELGPLPEEGDQVVFPTLQTYDNGEVVRWIDEPTSDGSEPENPAPALTLTEAEEDHHGSGESDDEAAASSSAEGPTAENAATEDDVSGATTVGVVGIVLGALGLVAAIFAIATSRRGRGGAPTDGDTPATESS